MELSISDEPTPARADDDAFRHATIDIDGVPLHYAECGEGVPILLVPGWPQSWYAWREVMPRLAAAGRRVIAIDPRGMGDSGHPVGRYDVGTVARDLHRVVEVLGLADAGGLDVAGHDVGAWIAYAWAADFPADVRRLALLEAALPGITPPPPAGVPSEAANLRAWHFAFNRLPDLPEILVQGHERAYLDWIFRQKSVRADTITPRALDEYVRVLAQPGGARTAFSYYRAAFDDAGLQANRERAERPLAQPVLAVGGEFGVGDLLARTMRQVAADVRACELAGVGHFVLEECPDEVARELAAFFAA